MIAIFLTYGLAFFCLALAVTLESRRASDLPLRRQLPWLAAFGLTHAYVANHDPNWAARSDTLVAYAMADGLLMVRLLRSWLVMMFVRAS